MDEKDLLKLWNTKRTQIIMAQISPALVLIAIMVLAAQGTFASASDAAKYLAIAVAAVTGFLAIVSQYAAIREAQALVQDLERNLNLLQSPRKSRHHNNFSHSPQWQWSALVWLSLR